MPHKALLIGINYRGTSSELNGCVNDVINMRKYIRKYYKNDIRNSNIHTLTDDTIKKPTHRNILREMDWLVSNISSGDCLFLHYSGHGSYVRDQDGDEEDGCDETLVPLDYKKRGLITDDYIRRRLLSGLPKGVRLFCIFDCCHSGTMLDLRFKYLVNNNSYQTIKYHQYPSSKCSVVTISGCKDSQSSADTREEGQYQGALTYMFLKLMKKNNNNISYCKLIRQLNSKLHAGGYTQNPRLCSGSSMSLNDMCEIFVSGRSVDDECVDDECVDEKHKKCMLF